MNIISDIRLALLPEAILTLVILLCTIFTFLFSSNKQKLLYYVSFAGIVITLLSFGFISFNDEYSVLWGSFISNSYTILFRILILVGTVFTLLLTKNYISGFGSSKGEFYVLLLTAALGGMLLVGSNDLIMLYISFETLSLSSYALCGYTKSDKLSNEAALKYLVIGAASTAILLFGFSFLYGISGNTNLTEIANSLSGYNVNLVLLLSFAFILGGFGYKLSAVPFHTWAPDVYQGAPIPVAAFLSVVSKIAGFGIIIRFLTLIFGNIEIWFLSLALIAILTMTVGNLMAVGQTNIKRLMAYSSIAQAGYLLIGLAIFTVQGISSIIFYLIVYLLMNFGAWAAIEIYVNETGKDSIKDFAGLAYTRPYLSLGFIVCLLSLAGIPITAGFFGKFYLFQAVAFAGLKYMWLLIIALINTLIGVFYYFKVIKVMFLKPEAQLEGVVSKQFNLYTALGIATVAVLIVGFLMTPFISLSEYSASKVKFFEIQQTK